MDRYQSDEPIEPDYMVEEAKAEAYYRLSSASKKALEKTLADLEDMASDEPYLPQAHQDMAMRAHEVVAKIIDEAEPIVEESQEGFGHSAEPYKAMASTAKLFGYSPLISLSAHDDLVVPVADFIAWFMSLSVEKRIAVSRTEAFGGWSKINEVVRGKLVELTVLCPIDFPDDVSDADAVTWWIQDSSQRDGFIHYFPRKIDGETADDLTIYVEEPQAEYLTECEKASQVVKKVVAGETVTPADMETLKNLARTLDTIQTLIQPVRFAVDWDNGNWNAEDEGEDEAGNPKAFWGVGSVFRCWGDWVKDDCQEVEAKGNASSPHPDAFMNYYGSKYLIGATDAVDQINEALDKLEPLLNQLDAFTGNDEVIQITK